MPRKDFIRDLQEASIPGKYAYLTNVRAGDDDGVLCFTYIRDGSSIDLETLVAELSSYPVDHSYFVYTTSENVPSAVTDTVQVVQSRSTGLPLSNFLNHLSDSIDNALSPDDHANVHTFSGNSDTNMVDDNYFSDDGDEWSDQSTQHPDLGDPFSDSEFVSTAQQGMLRTKIRADLRAVKNAGLKVGILGDIEGPVIVSVSCRIAKLGISDEAMQAWRVSPQQYLVLLIRYPAKYRELDQILDEDTVTGKSSVDMHVALCDSYKPSLANAEQVFMRNPKKTDAEETPGNTDDVRKMVPSFISRPLNALLNERLVKIAKYRYSFAFGWSGAELFFNDVQGKSIHSADPAEPKYFMTEKSGSPTSTFPNLLTSDHILESSLRLSFPLVAMQFTLRHFVRCTEFCLVCHCKIDAGFEALKPYVCSNALCLYQYMALGFGPSLEWEIIFQPNVVDLLVSFTYASATGSRLNDFPTGLGILVPDGTECVRDLSTGILTTAEASRCLLPGSEYAPRSYTAKLDRHKMELIFPDATQRSPVRAGDWIAIIAHNRPERNHLHCRVLEAEFWPSVKLSQSIVRGNAFEEPPVTLHESLPETVFFVVYDRNFDDLTDTQKRQVIPMLLDTLPGVEEMKMYLTQTKRTSEPLLVSWKERISRSALDVLRWIVASNRSCILQDGDPSDPKASYDYKEDMVSGMDGYMQFRFAQGAPDKEQRFVDSVNAATSRLNLKSPTLFAWHGSILANWHGIVREGLHFKDTLHGRAFGHGVYMSPHFMTSCGYMGGYTPYAGPQIWPQSKLRITSAISLNEVVNAPSEFVSCAPHLVVNQLDWIQPRYLFVKCDMLDASLDDRPANRIPPATKHYQQDPAYTAIGPHNIPVVIPITAISSRRRHSLVVNVPSSSSTDVKGEAVVKDKGTAKGKRKAKAKVCKRKKTAVKVARDEDAVSVETDHEDLMILLSDTETEKDNKVAKTHDDPLGSQIVKVGRLGSSPDKQTDFKPGTLAASSLQLLAPPSYATTLATKALQRDLKATLKVQDTTPPHELGWYLDPNLISTVYQWIVELHSFDPSLPLATDLKDVGLQSVVLELRFGKDYPISPPFVRVIRPRFLGFAQGGGGHVTAGGALCMELLTNTGWSAASSIESVLLQVRLAITSTDPAPARLEFGQRGGAGSLGEYGVGEAVQAFLRACRAHGWEVPKDFAELNQQPSLGFSGGMRN